MVTDDTICRFVHASDLHIGRFQYTNPIRAMDYIDAFHCLLDNIMRNSTDFVLLAGDVFNSIDLLPFYFSQVVELLRKFHEKTNSSIPIIAIEGNHDIRSFSRGNHISTNLSWLRVLANLELITLLDSSLMDSERNQEPVQIYNVNIYGNTYSGEKIDTNIHKIVSNISSNGSYNILINHFGVEGQMKGIPGQSKYGLDKHLKSRVNYLGLGHFHRQFVLDDYIFNPGCLSPACLSDFNLPHGYFLVDVKKEKKNFHTQIVRKQVDERPTIWKTVSIKSRPKSKHFLFGQIMNLLKEEVPIQLETKFNPKNKIIPILCITIRSDTGKLLSSAAKKELRSELLQTFAIVEVHIFQKQIAYKPIEGFFLPVACSTQS